MAQKLKRRSPAPDTSQRLLHGMRRCHSTDTTLERHSPAPEYTSQRLFHGVRMRNWGRWVSEVRIPNSRDKIWLGSYTTPEQAARAYDVASILLCRSSPLNFSDSHSLLNLPPLSAASSPPSRRYVQAIANLAALSAPGCDTISCLPPAHELASTGCVTLHHPYLQEDSTGCVTLHHPYCNIGPGGAYLQEDSSWIQEVRSLLVPDEPETMSSVSSTSNIGAAASMSVDAVLDAAVISLSFDGAAASSGAELQEEELSWEEYEDALQEMVAVDGFTATSAVVTTRERIDVDATPSGADIAPLWTLQ